MNNTQQHHTIPPTPRELAQYEHLGASPDLAARLKAAGLAPDIIVSLDHFAAESFVGDDPAEWPAGASDFDEAICLAYPPFRIDVLERAARAPWDMMAVLEWSMYGGTLARVLDVWGAGIAADLRDLVPNSADAATIIAAAQAVADAPLVDEVDFELDEVRFTISADGFHVANPELFDAHRVFHALGGAAPAVMLDDAWEAATRVAYPRMITSAFSPVKHLVKDDIIPGNAFRAAYQLRQRIMAARAVELATILPTSAESFAAEHPDVM